MTYDAYFSDDAKSFQPSAIRRFARLINDPAIISFAGGVPNPATFPAAELSSIAERLIRENKGVSLQYGPTRGLPRLREFVAQLCREREIETAVDEIILTTGSQQALSLVAASLLDPGDVVLVELPSYIGALSAFHARRAEMIGVEQDDDGVVSDSLREVATRARNAGKRIKFLYTIPNFQNPSGRLMNAARRAEVSAIARELGFLILEDDPYGELVYDAGAVTTPIKSLAPHDHVMYLGTFSKILAPGLRCGWISAPEPLVTKFELAKEAADLCSGMLDQAIVDEYCAAGKLPEQVERVRQFYTARRGVLMQALADHFEGRARWTEARGGLFTWMTLAAERDTREDVPRA
ncbi:MAG TPA: PLP-dependent aminotransferase family protein, partial [Thermoanaerobaculia bacterium]